MSENFLIYIFPSPLQAQLDVQLRLQCLPFLHAVRVNLLQPNANLIKYFHWISNEMSKRLMTTFYCVHGEDVKILQKPSVVKIHLLHAIHINQSQQLKMLTHKWYN
ncbi:Proline--tRNA ligase [Trichinella spiralis]|uniref:Proline--tRNA ligase n=1 Tax=Trichinella spiralis TaxID=6334 RepID=A0ABR3KD08_TRISP